MELVTSVAAWLSATVLLLLVVVGPHVLVPQQLRHLPRVPVLPLLWSYLRGESDDERIRRLILPFATEKNEELVLVWALGRWVVHILDLQVRDRRVAMNSIEHDHSLHSSSDRD